MSPLEFLCQPIWQRLGLALLHFLWQGVVIATAVLAVVYLLRLRHGNARYAMYLLGFMAMSVCPLVTFTMLETPEPAAAVPAVAQDSSEPVDSSAYRPVPPSPVRQALLDSDVSPVEQDTAVAAEVLVPLLQRISEYLQRLLPWGVLGWFAGVVVLSVRLLLGFVGMHRWRRRIEQLPKHLRERVAVLSSRLGMNSFSRVFVSPAALEAVAIGYLRPMVLLPVSMVTQMPPEMLEAVIAHELAHIRRFDLWVNLFQRVAETLLFYHPAVWWLSSRLRAEREFCCDEMAVKATRQRATYASALENVARARPLFKSPALAAGLGRGDKPILGRVRNVLGLAPTHQNSRFWVAGMIAMLLLAALVVPPAIALTKDQSGRTAGGTSEGASRVEAGTRVIHFPKDQSMGTLGSSETSAQQLSLAEYLKDWPGQGTMEMRAEPATVAQREQAGMAGTTIGTVVSTVREGPARDAGLQTGDFIVRVAGIDVRSQHHLIALTRAMAPGTKVNVEFVRWGQKMATDVVLDRLTRDDYPILAGSVHLPNGQPAAGAMVYASVFYDQEWISISLPYLTDVRGHFISRFPSRAEPGRCFLLATTYDGYAGHAVVDFPIRAPIEIRLEKGKVTQGRLYTDKGEGLPDIFMEVGPITIPGIEGDFRAVCELRTDHNGSFVLPALPVGSKVALDFAVPGYARPSRGPYDLSRLQEGLLFGAGGIPQGAVIEGVVIASDTGEPLGPFSLTWRNDSAKVSEPIQVDALGRFKADTLPAGQTTVYIDEYQMRDLRYTVTEKVLDLQPRQEVTGLRLSAEPFGVVTGKVTDRATKTGLADFGITAWNETFPAEVFDTRTDVDGTYRLAIPAGNIKFSLPEGRGKQIRIRPGRTIDNVDFVAKAPSQRATVDGTEAAKPDTRVIHFPKDQSMGIVYVGELRTTDPLWWQGWEEVGEAKGDVAVPADKDVRLTVNTNGLEHLSFLEALGPDDIQAMNFVYPLKRLDDKDLVHLAGLTGLRLLRIDGASIRGEGLRHLTKLKRLESLGLHSTEVGDEALKHVGQIRSLLALGLATTPVTDKGLAHVAEIRSLLRQWPDR
jgi:beta-lactamase regulating signal transducer with metallopeptidase domain